MQPLIRLNDISKDYGRLRALDRVSLEIGPGITGLLGPNGAGKTTLIKVLLGLVKISSGHGEVLGFRLGHDARAIRAKVGYLPEDDCYIAGLSGVEMVQFMARLWGQPATEALRRSHEMLDYSGLQQERYRDVATYATGMRQKLKFAQAIVHDPPLLIFDEPTAGLDPEEREAMLGRIRSLATRSGKTVILSTHILPDVQSVCDKLIVMARGQVRLVESLEVLRQPAAPSWRVSVVGSVPLLTAEVERAGYRAEPESNNDLRIVGLPIDRSAQIWEWARAAGVGLRSVMPARTSLEQIFLEAIQEGNNANP